MIADTLLLLRIRWKMSWNTFFRQKALRKILLAILAIWIGVSLVGVSAGVGLGVAAIIHTMQRPQVISRFPELADMAIRIEPLMPGLLLTAATILLIASSFGIALGSLYLSSDLDLLMVAPVDRRAVFASKLLEGLGWYYALLLVIGLPALIVMGIRLNYTFLYYPLMVLALLGAPLLATGIGALAVMLVARFAPARRVREVLGLVAALFGISCSLLSQVSRVWFESFGSFNADPTGLARLLDRFAGLPLPTLFAGQGLAAAGHGQFGTAFLDLTGYLLLTFGLFVGCVWLADRLYYGGWARMQSSGNAKRGKARAQAAARRSPLRRGPVEVAVALKDWRVIPRDLRNFAQLLAPLLILPIVYINMVTSLNRQPRASAAFATWANGLTGFTNAGIAAVILGTSVLVFTRIAVTGISMEGRAWWLIKGSPLTPAEILRGKFLTAFIPFAILSTLLLIGAALLRRFSPLGALYGWYGIELLGAGILGVNVSLGVAWAKLDWDDPRRMVSGIGGILSFVAVLLFGLLGGLFLMLPLLASSFLPDLSWLGWSLGLLLPLILTSATLVLSLNFGIMRMDKVGEI